MAIALILAACKHGPPQAGTARREPHRPACVSSDASDAALPCAPAPSGTVASRAPTAAPAPLLEAPVLDGPHLEGASGLVRVFARLAVLESGRARDDVRILQYGDSHTASDTSTSVVRRILQERFGDGGRGFIALGRPWKTYVQDGVHGGMRDFEPNRPRLDDARSLADGAYGLVGVAIESDRRGARAWTKIEAPTSRVEVAYLEHPAGGSVDVVIDGEAVGRIATRAPVATSGFAGFDVPDAPHEVELRAVGDGDVRVFGLALDRLQPGVVLDALGINGAEISTPLRWNEEHFTEQLRHRAPDLVILAYGTNEALDGKLDRSTYERELVELLGRIARAVPNASCLLLGPPDLARPEVREAHGGREPRQTWTTWPPLLGIIEVQRQVARAAGCAFFDQMAAMGGPGSIAAWADGSPPLAQSDRVHMTMTGYTALGTAFANELFQAYDAWRHLHAGRE